MNMILSLEWVQKTFMQLLKGWANDRKLASHCFHFPRAQPRDCPSLLTKVLCWEEAKKSLPIRKYSEQDSDLSINLGEG